MFPKGTFVMGTTFPTRKKVSGFVQKLPPVGKEAFDHVVRNSTVLLRWETGGPVHVLPTSLRVRDLRGLVSYNVMQYAIVPDEGTIVQRLRDGVFADTGILLSTKGAKKFVVVSKTTGKRSLWLPQETVVLPLLKVSDLDLLRWVIKTREEFGFDPAMW
jgi:hypothetical protein